MENAVTRVSIGLSGSPRCNDSSRYGFHTPAHWTPELEPQCSRQRKEFSTEILFSRIAGEHQRSSGISHADRRHLTLPEPLVWILDRALRRALSSPQSICICQAVDRRRCHISACSCTNRCR